jgi:hypothetical protein
MDGELRLRRGEEIMIDLNRFEIRLRMTVEAEVVEVIQNAYLTEVDFDNEIDYKDILEVTILERETGYHTNFKTKISADMTNCLLEAISEEIKQYWGDE